MTEQSYRVEWVIDVEAESPLEAAMKAWDAMRNEDSISNVFTVRRQPMDGTRCTLEWEVDLNSQRCARCQKEIAYDGVDQWVSRDEALLCRGVDSLDLAIYEHVPMTE